MFSQIEDRIIAILTPALSQYEVLVIACPNDLADLAKPSRNRVVVQFKRVSYDIPNQSNVSAFIQQTGIIRYEILTQFRGLRTHIRCLDVIDTIGRVVTGLIPDLNMPYFFYQTDGSFVDFIDGFWIYRSVFEVKVSIMHNKPHA